MQTCLPRYIGAVGIIDGPDAPLWVSESGSGEPVTVIAHGLSSSSADIAGIGAGMSGTRVLLDFRGHGRSPGRPGLSYDQTAMARDLTFVADRFGASCAVGVSLGAATILRILSDDPARFRAACLIMPAWIDGPSPDRAANAHLADLLEREGTEGVEADVAATAEFARLCARSPRWNEILRGQARRMGVPGLIDALREYPSGLPPVSDPAALSRVGAQALVLGHEGDPGHPAEVARRLGTLLAHSDVRIENEPLRMLDDMEACGRSISSFFARAPAPIA